MVAYSTADLLGKSPALRSFFGLNHDANPLLSDEPDVTTNARLLARQDFHPAEVASARNGAKAFRPGDFASLLGHRGEHCTVMADVGDFVRND